MGASNAFRVISDFSAGGPPDKLAKISIDDRGQAIVTRANPVVNPAAREVKSSPIYGMPIISVDEAYTVFVLKRSMASSFAGKQTPLFFKPNTRMLFGDAK